MKTKRILALVVAFCILLTMAPNMALAFEITPYVWVGDVDMYVDATTVTYYKNGSSTLAGSEGDYNVKFDPTTNTLTFNNANPTCSEEAPMVEIEGLGDVTLALVGENIVTANDTHGDSLDSIGIYCDGNLTITGDGSLTVSGGTAWESHSVAIRGEENITINGGTINAIGGVVTRATGTNNFGTSIGIQAYGGIVISGGVVTAQGSDVGEMATAAMVCMLRATL